MSGVFGASHLFFSGTSAFYEFDVTNSLRFDDGTSTDLTRTPSSTGDEQIFTISCWVKRGNISSRQVLFATTNSAGNDFDFLEFQSDDTLRAVGNNGSASLQYQLTTSALFRDVSAWYNIVLAYDTTQSTASNRIKLYVNGTQITAFGTSSYPSQNYDTRTNTQVDHRIGSSQPASSTLYFDGYIAEFNLIDGQQLSPTSFGETKSGVWIAKNTSGLTFGTNGFRLQFKETGTGTASSSTIGADTSGQANHYTSVNLIAEDVVPDSPTLNYAVMNPLDGPIFSTAFGNLRVNGSSSSAGSIGSTIFPTTGKWYAEMVAEDMGNGMSVGIKSDNEGTFWKPTRGKSVIYQSDGNKIIDGGSATSYGATYTVGDIIGIKINLDDGEIEFLKNNASQGNASTALTSGVAFGVFFLDTSSSNNARSQFNFGQDSSFHNTVTSGSANASDENGHGNFYYAVPSGYLALNSANLPETTITPLQDDIPEDYFNTVLYAGNSADRNIEVGFKSNFIWVKSRDTSDNHRLYNVIAGEHACLFSNQTNAESTATDGIAFDFATGFNIDDGANRQSYNKTGEDYVSWNWLAGGTPSATNNAGAGNAPTSGSVLINGSASTASLAGTIPATKISANTEAGFSVVSYSGNGSAGATIAHGLSSVPDMIMVKDRTSTGFWSVYHSANTSAPETELLRLNTSDATLDGNVYWNDTAPTASVFSVGTSSTVNNSSRDYIAYCFNRVEGYSKFGSYTGTGSSDGTYIYTGFRPAYVLIKQTSASGNNWNVHDNKRDVDNVVNTRLLASTSSAETTFTSLDFVSNGFKLRNTGSAYNGSGHDYIYMAFAEMPFKYANAR